MVSPHRKIEHHELSATGTAVPGYCVTLIRALDQSPFADPAGKVLAAAGVGVAMEPHEVAALIEANVEDAEATVEPSRHADDADHLQAVVISPAFEDRSLLEQHRLVYDALGEHMTRDIHALELQTYTPTEYEPST